MREGGREHGKGGRSGGGIERGMEQGRVIQGRYPEEDTGQYTVYSSTCHERPPTVRSESGPSWQVAPRGRWPLVAGNGNL